MSGFRQFNGNWILCQLLIGLAEASPSQRRGDIGILPIQTIYLDLITIFVVNIIAIILYHICDYHYFYFQKLQSLM